MICNPIIDAILGGANKQGVCQTDANGGLAIATLMARLFRGVVIVGGLALLLYLGWGGINWITSGGDKSKVEAAQHQITNAIIGMVFVVATVAIITLLNLIFGFDLLKPQLGAQP